MGVGESPYSVAFGVSKHTALAASVVYLIGNTLKWLENDKPCTIPENYEAKIAEFEQEMLAQGGEKIVIPEEDLNQYTR